MRFFALAFIGCLTLAAPAFAQQSTTPGYTKFDQQQFAKLRATVGTWKCVDVPASKKADVITTSQDGNWFVSKETGEDPSTSYTRWSHGYQQFFTMTMSSQGNGNVMVTKAPDPNNAVWTFESPIKSPQGKPFLPITTSLSGNTVKSTGAFYDNKGKLQHFTSTCTKV